MHTHGIVSALHKQHFLFPSVQNVFVKVKSFLSLPQEIKEVPKMLSTLICLLPSTPGAA